MLKQADNGDGPRFVITDTRDGWDCKMFLWNVPDDSVMLVEVRTAGDVIVSGFLVSVADITDLAAALQHRQWSAKARQNGAAAGVQAAKDSFDGNTTDATYRKILNLVIDGDPEMDGYDMSPDGDPEEIANELDIPGTRYFTSPAAERASDELVESLVGDWEAAARDAYWVEVEGICRDHLQ